MGCVGSREFTGTLGANQSETWTIGQVQRPNEGFFDHGDQVTFNAHQAPTGSGILPLGNEMSVSNIRSRVMADENYNYVVTINNHGGWSITFHLKVWW